MREDYIVHGVLHQHSRDLRLGEVILLVDSRFWLIRIVIVMRIDHGMTTVAFEKKNSESLVFGCFRESVGHPMFMGPL